MSGCDRLIRPKQHYRITCELPNGKQVEFHVPEENAQLAVIRCRLQLNCDALCIKSIEIVDRRTGS